MFDGVNVLAVDFSPALRMYKGSVEIGEKWRDWRLFEGGRGIFFYAAVIEKAAWESKSPPMAAEDIWLRRKAQHGFSLPNLGIEGESAHGFGSDHGRSRAPAW